LRALLGGRNVFFELALLSSYGTSKNGENSTSSLGCVSSECSSLSDQVRSVREEDTTSSVLGFVLNHQGINEVELASVSTSDSTTVLNHCEVALEYT